MSLINTTPRIDQSSSALPTGSSLATPVRATPVKLFRPTFSDTLVSGVDSDFFTAISSGTGQTISQSNGNLIISSGTTANSGTIIRSTQPFIGPVIFKQQTTLSQRIINNNFFAELVDVIGDNLAFTVNSSTSITVTIPNSTFDVINIGQSMYIGAFTLAGCISERYTIASVSGNNVTFTVSGFPSSGTGTCSLFGWNYYQLEYDGTSVTLAKFDTQRRGWAAGITSTTVNSTTVGHMTIITGEDGVGALLDQLVSSSTTNQTTMRASHVTNLPDETVPLYLQFRCVNGSVAPVSSTTWTIGMCSVENYASQPVNLINTKAQSFNTPQPVQLPTTNTIVTDVPFGTITNSETTSAITPTVGIGYKIVILVTGTPTGTFDLSVEESDDGTNWFAVYQFQRITTSGNFRSPIIRYRGNRIRYVQTIGGGGASFNRQINRMQTYASCPLIVQFFDRSISLNTLGSATPSYLCEGITSLNFSFRILSQTTAGTLAYQTSDDNVNWSNITTQPTTLTVTRFKIDNEQGRFVRITVTAAASGAILDYVGIKGIGP